MTPWSQQRSVFGDYFEPLLKDASSDLSSPTIEQF